MQKILFNDKYGLTNAVLNMDKIQTRRIAKLTNIYKRVDIDIDWDKYISIGRDEGFTKLFESLNEIDQNKCIECLLEYSKYKKNEIVAIAQSYKNIDGFYEIAAWRKFNAHGQTVEPEDCVNIKEIIKWREIRKEYNNTKAWNNKLFVKPDLMLHFIKIEDIRIERLQNISDEDCLKEGIKEFNSFSTKDKIAYTFDNINTSWITPREAYSELINKVSKYNIWQENPFVYVYDFRVIK